MFHKNAALGDIHRLNNWEVANPAALAALTPTVGEVGRVAVQLAPYNVFILKDITPTWVSILGGGAVAAVNVAVVDAGGYFTGSQAEVVLQEIGLTLGNLISDLVTINTAIDFAEIQCIPIACSDETSALTAGAGKVTFRMPYAFTLTAVKASVTTAPTGSVLTVDINENGTTILSTKLTIDATEKTSTTAATAAVISDSSLADDAEITIDLDTVGSTVAGAGLKVYLIGRRA